MDAARHVVAAPTAEHIHRLYETLTVLQENTR
jgi:hypothetical protein